MAVLRRGQEAVIPKPPKPTVSELGIDLAAQAWQRSGQGDGAIEVAFATGPGSSAPASSAPASLGPASPGPGSPGPADPSPPQWVLLRVAGDPDQRVLVFDRHEWECFLDGARNGEFDDAAAADPSPSPGHQPKETPVNTGL
jgi:hypothetical protein